MSLYKVSTNKVRKTKKPEPWHYAGIVAWLGWGGTNGIDWAKRISG